MNKFLGKALFFSLVMFSLFSACAKKSENDNAQNKSTKAQSEQVSDSIPTENEAANPPEDLSSGVIYTQGAGLYHETAAGKMQWVAEAQLGDIATYLGEKKEALRTDGKKRTFFHIVLNEKEYWIQDYGFEPDTVVAFISADDVVLYTAESLTAVSDEIIPKYTIIAVSNKSINNNSSQFLKIATYSSELLHSWTVKDKFIKRNLVELGEADVKAMILAKIATTTKNETIKAELFKNAIESTTDYRTDIEELQELDSIMESESKFLKKIKTEKVEKTFPTLYSTDLLSIPQVNARIVANVEADTTLVASKKTVLTDQQGNATEWYFVRYKHKKGWLKTDLYKDNPESTVTND